MAEKLFRTRVQLKYDTLANWNKVAATFVLKKGEIAIAEIPLGDTSGVSKNPPAVMMKVGDGSTIFSSLPWFSALAADVYNWAKKPTLDPDDLPTIPLEKLPELTGVVHTPTYNLANSTLTLPVYGGEDVIVNVPSSEEVSKLSNALTWKILDS